MADIFVLALPLFNHVCECSRNAQQSATTEYYDIRIVISGSSITETVGDNEVSGTYVYKNQKLICSYGENNIFVYRIDPNTKTIDCGDGIPMHKVR